MSWISRIVDRAFGTARIADAEPPQVHQAPALGGGGWQNAMTGMGGARDPATQTTYGFQTPLSELVRDNLYEYEPMTGIVIDRPATDIVRRGLEFEGFAGFDMVRLLSKLDDLEMDDKIKRATAWSRKDGGSAILTVVNDGRPYVAPIDYARMTDVANLVVLTRRELSVAQWNWDPGTRGYGEPLFYYINTPGALRAANLVHRDRIIRFVNGDLSHQAMMRHNGWGVSTIDRIWNPLRAKGAALSALSTILSSYAVDVVKIKGLADAMKLGAKEEMQKRANLMQYTLGNLSKIFIDAEGEDFTPLVRSASGLAELVELLIDECQAATCIPKSILRGISPGGLGDGENAGEIRGYYDYIGGQQKPYYVRPATRIIDLTLRSRFGPSQGEAPDHWCVKPRPLWTPTDNEVASIRAQNAAARAADFMTGNISREEYRSDPTLRACYDLTDDDLTDAVDVSLFPDGETPLSTAEAAAMFGKNPSSIRTMIASGAINNYKFNGRYVVSQQEILRAVKGTGATPAAALPEAGAAA